MKRYRWRIDEMEGDVASIEAEGRRIDVPRAILPAGAREDWILAVEVDHSAAGSAAVRITHDVRATEAALQRSVEQLRQIRRPDDRGDDIEL